MSVSSVLYCGSWSVTAVPFHERKISQMNGLRLDFQDTALRFRIESFLSSRHFPEFKNLDVSVNNGQVKLSGLLRSYYEKQVAINSCLRVAGVTTIVDNIDVKIKKPK